MSSTSCPGLTAITNYTRRCCVLLPDVGEVEMGWKLRVGGHNYKSQFRGSAPSLKAFLLKASLKILLSNMWV